MARTLKVIAAILFDACFWGDSGCNNQILQDAQSPDGRRHAVVFERDCGATTDFSTQVSVLTRGMTVNGGGNVFTAESDHGKAAAGPGGGPNVTVRWLDKRTLEIRYDSHARIFARDTRHDDTDIRYVADTIYQHSAEAIGTVRQIYDGALTPEMAVNTFRNIDRLFPTRTVPRSSRPYPLPAASVALRTVSFSDGGRRYDLDDYLELNRVAGLLVLKDGRIKLEEYRFGNSERTRWMSMSIAKSITSTLVGAALKQGYIAALSDPVTKYVPSLRGSAYEGVSVRDVLMMSSGVRWDETYTDPRSDRRRLLEAQISQAPGSAMEVMKSLPRAAPPGTVSNYNTGETQVTGEIVRSAVGQPLAAYLSDRIWSRFGMEADAKWWLDSNGGHEIGGSGFSATLRDYGRFGLFMLNGGIAAGEAILPDGWTREATSPKVLRGGAPLHYGYLWWTGTTAASQRDGAYSAEGIFGQSIYVNPAAHVVIVVWSAQQKPTGSAVINDWVFFDAVVDALK